MIAIIGGGAAGLFAAVQLARANSGEQVAVFDRLDRVGKKLLATGNGRCNITNAGPYGGHYYGCVENAMPILTGFTPDDAMACFESMGVICTIEDEGKTYPLSGQATSVLDALRDECAHLGVIEKCGFAVGSIRKMGDEFFISARSGEGVKAKAALIATGGKAQASLGSDGSGYPLLKLFGHSCTELHPAIVQLKTSGDAVRALDGIKCRAGVTLLIDGAEIRREQGELLFTNYGVSGPPVMQLSTAASAALADNPQASVVLQLDVLPQFEGGELYSLLIDRTQTISYKPSLDFLNGLVNKRLGQTIMKLSGAAPLAKSCGTLKPKDVSAVANQLKKWQLRVTGTMPFTSAQVTAGGVPLSEFTPELMSKLCPGLFAAGEVLNVNGDCGGYNLQWAWASAHAAAEGILNYLDK